MKIPDYRKRKPTISSFTSGKYNDSFVSRPNTGDTSDEEGQYKERDIQFRLNKKSIEGGRTLNNNFTPNNSIDFSIETLLALMTIQSEGDEGSCNQNEVWFDLQSIKHDYQLRKESLHPRLEELKEILNNFLDKDE